MRNSYYDFLRGIAILMVIGIHTFGGYSFDTLSGNVNIIVRQLLNTAVPLFLAISAFFLCRKPLDTSARRNSFWRRQIPKVYIPCLLWSVPQYAADVWQGANPFTHILFLFIGGVSVYYFIALFIQYYLLLPWLQPFGKRLMLWSVVVSVVSIMVVTCITSVEGMSPPLIVYAGNFLLWMMFFVMGGYIGTGKMRNSSLLIPALVAVAGFVMSYFESHYLATFHDGGFGIKPSSFLFSAGVIMLLLNSKVERRYNASNILCCSLAYVGCISFGIYLVHCYFKIVLKHVHTFDSWYLTWGVVAVLSILFIAVCRKLLPDRLLRYMGF